MKHFQNLPASLLLISIAALASFGILACGDDTTSLVEPSESAAVIPVTPGETSMYRGEGAIAVEPHPVGEYRQCDNSTSEYTPDAPTGTGSGSGSTIMNAMDNAVLDALKKDVFGQFTCSVCDDSDDRCDPFISDFDLAGAVMSSPSTDCHYNSTTKKYECSGEVNFNGASGSLPVLRAGCKTCP